MSSNESASGGRQTGILRVRIAARGQVQGVGFRPFVFRLATELGLTGWVSNTAQGAVIEIQGPRDSLVDFLSRMEREKPPLCSFHSLEQQWLDAVAHETFVIRPSADSGPRSAFVLPDIATCPDCRREIQDPSDRRYFYPFTNCTNCGPRFSIIEHLPYDRPNTSMKHFRMCAECQAEYTDPANRRFHAQPNACPMCGPQISLSDRQRRVISESRRDSFRRVLEKAAACVGEGQVLALKGLGGFHLLTSAADASAIQRLRTRKLREEKPLALMFPNLESARRACEISGPEERLLLSPEAPIVLLKRRCGQGNSHGVDASVAPGNPYLGVMLPYTPLHHLLLALFQGPVVATSGNLSDEPICIENEEALVRMQEIADLFLLHERPILRHVDDSIVRVILGRELVLRRARGYAPLPLLLPKPGPSVLAVGAHLKNVVALSRGNEVFLSQHIGDLETQLANDAFEKVIGDLQGLLEVSPQTVAADLHPDYISTRYARELTGATGSATLNLVSVQHHLAHVFSCMAENEQTPPVLGVSWDGTGYGLDGTVWGGEFFLVQGSDWRRFAHLRPFRLPGGEAAIKEPRRSALGVLYELFGEATREQADLLLPGAFTGTETRALTTMLSRRLNSPETTSAGRLFDAAAALVGLRQVIRFEGQAAMELEFAAHRCQTNEAYSFTLQESSGEMPTVLDWEPVIQQLLIDLRNRVALETISSRFHNALAEAIVQVARKCGMERIMLSGGCFQNACLLQRAVQRLYDEGFKPYWHQRVPPGDGGISLGQVAFTHWSGENSQRP